MMSDSDDEFGYQGDGDREGIVCLLPFEAAKVRLIKSCAVWGYWCCFGEKSRTVKMARES